ncbi:MULTISPECIES: transposase [unclassified Streptomyces]|uniref:transposase n=1 Tax=unclassified Streptomyces TaxID=2593676 RepID=UPI001BE82290|nr:transposase [Streptomyces sp. ISL-21]MBT2608621.1 transposase [Streptomyces sp. ISL-87]
MRCSSRPEALSETEQLCLKAVLAQCPELEALTGHVRSFAEMMTQRQGERLPQWIEAVRCDDLPSLHALAAGIERDRDAVTAGLTWSCGVVEGHVNRIKMVKRQMFGRACFALLRSESCSPDVIHLMRGDAARQSAPNHSSKRLQARAR